jgi:hypothetical protein
MVRLDVESGLNAIFKEHFGVTNDEYLNLRNVLHMSLRQPASKSPAKLEFR